MTCVIAHLSDLHLRDAGDAVWLDRQLDRIVARAPGHVAITGDLLDRWDPTLLERILDALGSHELLGAGRLTILHGNHDLASSGGHPRRGVDMWRLAMRFWDPPPLTVLRRRRFYEAIARRAADVSGPAPFSKGVNGARLAVLDTIPLLWKPLRLEGDVIAVQHALGCVRRAQVEWLSALPHHHTPLVVLLHHYPLGTPSFQWSPERGSRLPVRAVRVPMEVSQPGRDEFWAAAARAGTRLVLCGHVHRARLEWHDGIAVGLNGQSGAAWAGRTIAYYTISDGSVGVEYETLRS